MKQNIKFKGSIGELKEAIAIKLPVLHLEDMNRSFNCTDRFGTCEPGEKCNCNSDIDRAEMLFETL